MHHGAFAVATRLGYTLANTTAATSLELHAQARLVGDANQSPQIGESDRAFERRVAQLRLAPIRRFLRVRRLSTLRDEHVERGNKEEGEQGPERHAGHKDKADAVSSGGPWAAHQDQREVAEHGRDGGHEHRS